MSTDDLRRILDYLEDAQTRLDGIVANTPTEDRVFEYVSKARTWTIRALEAREKKRRFYARGR